MSFAGKNIKITRVLMEGPRVSFDLVFADDEGVVHAHMKHSLIEPPASIRAAAAELLSAISDHAHEIHFGEAPRERERRATGIAESFSGPPDPAENPEGQG